MCARLAIVIVLIGILLSGCETEEGEKCPPSLPTAPSDGTIEYKILFTYVPTIGSTCNLKGKVVNVNPADYRVVVYIYVGGAWWIKPYWNNPITVIQSDGSWECDITTGGVDEQATKIRAYLIIVGYSPPLYTLPPDPPNPEIIDMVEVVR